MTTLCPSCGKPESLAVVPTRTGCYVACVEEGCFWSASPSDSDIIASALKHAEKKA